MAFVVRLIIGWLMAVVAKKRKIRQGTAFWLTLTGGLVGIVAVLCCPKQKFKDDYNLMPRCKQWGLPSLVLGGLMVVVFGYFAYVRSHDMFSSLDFMTIISVEAFSFSFIILGLWLKNNALKEDKIKWYEDQVKKNKDEIW